MGLLQNVSGKGRQSGELPSLDRRRRFLSKKPEFTERK